MTWYCVHTRPQMEAKASEYLRRQGYRAWFPFTREKRNWQQGSKRVFATFDRPFFSRYIFVELSRPGQSLYEVDETFGVATVVKRPYNRRDDPLELEERALPIPPGVIAELMARTDDEGLVIQERPPHWFKGQPGDELELKDDPSGLYGLRVKLASLQGLDERSEIRIFVTMLGAEREIPIPVERVARVIGR